MVVLLGLRWFHVFLKLFMVESRGPVGQTLLPLRVCCPGPRHSVTNVQQIHVQAVNINIQQFCNCFLGGRNAYMCTFLLWCWALGATRLRKQKKSILSTSTQRILQYSMVFTRGYPYHFHGEPYRFNGEWLRCTVGKCRGFVRFARRSEINCPVKKNVRLVSAPQ